MCGLQWSNSPMVGGCEVGGTHPVFGTHCKAYFGYFGWDNTKSGVYTPYEGLNLANQIS